MYRWWFLLLSIMTAACVAGCASSRAPAPGEPSVSVINVLSWDNALSGKRDGLRSSWPLHKLRGHAEQFPLAQVKQCDGAVRSWGVVKAARVLRSAKATAGGVAVQVAVDISVARSQEQQTGPQQARMAIPADVAALGGTFHEERTVELAFGQVMHVGFPFGIAYDLRAERLDGAGQPIDKCALPFF